MGPQGVELGSQDARGLESDPNAARDHDVIIRHRQAVPVQTETFANLPLQPVSLNAIDLGLDG